MSEAYVILIFKNAEDFAYCDKRMKITSDHVALNEEGDISVLVKTENIRLPQGTLTVKTESGRNIRIQVASGYRVIEKGHTDGRNQIFPDLTQSFSKLELTDNLDKFFNKYYVRGDMTSLSAMIRKPGWHKSFRNSVEVKPVAVCKSCRKKALKGCCNEYSASNRTTVLMVLGWVEK